MTWIFIILGLIGVGRLRRHWRSLAVDPKPTITRAERVARLTRGMPLGHPEHFTAALSDADEELLAAIAFDEDLDELVEAVLEEGGR